MSNIVVGGYRTTDSADESEYLLWLDQYSTHAVVHGLVPSLIASELFSVLHNTNLIYF